MLLFHERVKLPEKNGFPAEGFEVVFYDEFGHSDQGTPGFF